jgi:hypothetical protein
VKQMIITFAALIVAFPLVILFAYWYLHFMLNLIVGQKHLAINWILDTGEVPPQWQKKPFLKKEKKSHITAPWAMEVDNSCINKLKKLINYAKVTTLIKDEEEKKDVIKQLESVKCEWEKRRLANEQQT